MTKRKANDLFFQTFIGEYVLLLTKLKTTSIEHTEEGSTESTNLASFEGFILDVDDNFYYIGDDHQSVNKAIRKDQIVYIAITDPNSQYDTIMDEAKEPEDKKGYN